MGAMEGRSYRDRLSSSSDQICWWWPSASRLACAGAAVLIVDGCLRPGRACRLQSSRGGLAGHRQRAPGFWSRLVLTGWETPGRSHRSCPLSDRQGDVVGVLRSRPNGSARSTVRETSKSARCASTVLATTAMPLTGTARQAGQFIEELSGLERARTLHTYVKLDRLCNENRIDGDRRDKFSRILAGQAHARRPAHQPPDAGRESRRS